MKVVNLKTNYSSGIPATDSKKPMFSWEITEAAQSSFQIAYRVEVSRNEDFSEKLWDSGIVESGNTNAIEYGGKTLLSGKRYFWRVTVWGDSRGESAVSETASWQTGLREWNAEWITPDTVFSDNAPLLRKKFDTKKCRRAVMYVFSPGWYELYINGEKADDRVLAPNYSSEKYYFYDTYDLTDKIKSGANCIGFWLGSGYCYKNYSVYTWRWRGVKRIIAELHLEYDDGSVRIVPTDNSWKSKSTSSVVYNHIYNGEIFDSELNENWFDTDYDDSNWRYARLTENKPVRKFMPSSIPPIKIQKTITPVSIRKNNSGAYILDFGQNFSGWVRIKLKNCKAGDSVTIRYAEETENGELDTYTNRSAKATDIYITNGSPEETWEPRFTYHGFRYVEVSGASYNPERDEIIGCVVYDALKETGKFVCDYEPLNKLYSNICWSLRSNAFSIMTDCPMRDERTPCLMDSDAYKEMSTFLWDGANYWIQWMLQKFSSKGFPDMAGVQILVAWHLYEEYGDEAILKKGYPFFVKYIDSIVKKWPKLIVKEEFGDWCAPKKEPDGNYFSSFSYVPETGTSLFYIEVSTAARIAEKLGYGKDAKRYKKLSENIKAAYNKEFFNEQTGIYSDGNLTAAVLPLYFGMVPEESRQRVYQSIKDGIINRNAGHLDTGIFGTKYLSLLLSENGDADLLLDAYFKKTYPSFGYQFEKGATTLWEQWSDAKGDMISHNHAMFGGAGVFMPQVIAGIKAEEPCYRRVKIEPHICSKIKHVICRQSTLCGEYSVEWTRNGNNFTLKADVPFNCTADVVLPNGDTETVNYGKHTFKCSI